MPLKRTTSVAGPRGGKAKDLPLADLGQLGGVSGLGKGRTELERLMSLYKAGLPPASVLAETEQKSRDELEQKQLNASLTVDLMRLEKLAIKAPEQRQAHEVEALRKELDKMKVLAAHFPSLQSTLTFLTVHAIAALSPGAAPPRSNRHVRSWEARRCSANSKPHPRIPQSPLAPENGTSELHHVPPVLVRDHAVQRLRDITRHALNPRS